MTPMPWTCRDDFRLWRRNWIKRPWWWLLWVLPWGDGADFRRHYPGHAMSWRAPGRIRRSDMEWGWSAIRETERDTP